MKVSKSIRVDRDSCELHGFVDLGEYTPEDKKDLLGEYALVFMFQPFRGKWVQTLGCFLTKGCSGSVLAHLVLECIILLEDSGFFVDCVVSDGASWNRNMWKQFGVDDRNKSCEHPSDDSRRLWFISDHTHLFKNVRNRLTKNKSLLVIIAF